MRDRQQEGYYNYCLFNHYALWLCKYAGLRYLQSMFGLGLETQRGENSGLVGGMLGRKKTSLGGGINMKTNAEMLEMVYK